MTGFPAATPRSTVDLLSYPVAWSRPRRLNAGSAWLGHIPFGMYLVGLLQPNVLVELGVHKGDSYCAFCQAVQELELPTKCFAVDTWRGDEHSGFYDEDVLRELRAHHDPQYGGFSQLLQSTFDEALDSFAAGTIDLLHVDGCHHYEAVRHDFETWLPKLSAQSVVLFHDTRENSRDFGVWRLWDELRADYPHLEFPHASGLGMLVTGANAPEAVRALTELDGDLEPRVQTFFAALGHRVELLVETDVSRGRGRSQSRRDDTPDSLTS